MREDHFKADVIVVGSGLAGSIIARKIAEEKEKRVLIVERRHQIGGNVYDYIEENGIRIQKYGPHTFHTNDREIYELLCKYTEMLPYHLKCQVAMKGQVTPSPFNKTTIFQFYKKEQAIRIYEAMRSEYGNKPLYITELLESHIECIREYATFLFENDYRLYTSKQWGIPPEEIDSSVLRRVPVRISECDTYFEDAYEAVPKNGFSKMMENLLDHPNIRIETGVDAKQAIGVDETLGEITYREEKLPLVYTGAIDELFEYRYGRLLYRSLKFKYQYYKKKDYQQAAIVAHPAAEGYTRTTEYTKLPYQDVGNNTVVAYEYPVPFIKGRSEPYYPVLTEETQKQYRQYLDYSLHFKNLYLCGRLADFKYYNMDQVIIRALNVYRTIEW